MLVFEQARRLAEAWIQVICGDGIVLVRDATIAKPYGWVFFYQSRAYLENPEDISEALAGNAPFVIYRESGEIKVLGTAFPMQDYLARLEADLPPAAMGRKPEEPAWT